MDKSPGVRAESTKEPDDSQAKAETLALQTQNLEVDKQAKEHLRQEKLRGVFSYCVIAILVLIFVLVGLSIISVVFHYLAPEKWHWMEPGNVKTVSTALFSGTLFVFLGLYVRDRV